MQETRADDPRRFGTLGGVFTPCTLTILGVIMFLRFGQVVGNAGLWSALLVVLLAKTITTLTAFSLSSIATNTRVEGGGAYFMISRSLGVEFGGSIGLVFFLAQAVSVSMYIVGFTEAAIASFPGLSGSAQTVATAVNAAVFLCVYVGAGWTIRIQYGILAILLLSLVSFAVGSLGSFSPELLATNLQSRFADGESFLTMFALFFPAATGIMAGANMSGELKDPARSIPRGTLWAILFTGVIYGGMALLLAGSAPRAELLSSNLIVRDLSSVPLLITAGIFAATLSSAIASMMGAPRILRALARDRIFRRISFFASGSGPSREPRRAIIATYVIAQVGILAGDLDAIAPIITMFFMVTYGCLNLATFYESYTRNPSYRPSFRLTHWTVALAGALACLAVMLLIELTWAILAIALMAGLYRIIARRRIYTAWGSVRSGTAFERARRELLRLERGSYHPKNWRPRILAFTGGMARPRQAVFGHWLCSGRGLLSLGQVISGEVEGLVERRRAQEEVLRKFILDQGLQAFPAVVVSRDRASGIEALVQCHGIGTLRPNTVLAGWSTDPNGAAGFIESLRTVARMGQSLILLHDPGGQEVNPWRAPRGRIDVWWRGKQNGPLMLLLAHLLVQNAAWSGRPIRLLRVVPSEEAVEDSKAHLTELLRQARIRAQPRVVVDEDSLAAIKRTSANAAVTLLGFAPPGDGEAEEFLERTTQLLEGLGTTLLVHSNEAVELNV